MIRSALNAKGSLFPAFPLGGAVRNVDVGGSWVDLLGDTTIDLVMIRVPAGGRVMLMASTDDIAGTASTADQADLAWPLDPGVWTFCTDRDFRDGPRFYLAASDGESARVSIMSAASA